MPIDWKTKRSVADALAAKKPDLEALAEAFDPEKKAHVAVLHALEADQLAALGLGRFMAHKIAYVAQEEVMAGRYEPALRLCDALTASKKNAAAAPASGLGVALYAVQDDNHHLGVMPERAKRYLARAVPYGAKEGAIYINAACVAMEIGDADLALDLIGKARESGREGWKELQKEKVFAKLRKDPRFLAAFAPKPLPEIDPKRAAKKIKNGKAIERWREWIKDRPKKYEAPGDVWPTKKASQTKVDFWWKNRGGGGKPANEHFQRFAETGDGSLLAVWAAEGKSFDDGPVVLLGGEGELYVLAENVPHALSLLASIGADGLDYSLEVGSEAEHDDEMMAWVAKQFGIVTEVPAQRYVKDAGKAHGLAQLKKLVAKLDAGPLG